MRERGEGDQRFGRKREDESGRTEVKQLGDENQGNSEVDSVVCTSI